MKVFKLQKGGASAPNTKPNTEPIEARSCCPMGQDVAKAAAGTLFMASKLLSRYETDIGIDTQPMADLLQKAVSDWALNHGASADELNRALNDLHLATQGTKLDNARH